MPGTAKRPSGPRGESRTLVEIRDRLARIEASLVALVRASSLPAEEVLAVARGLADNRPEIPIEEVRAQLGA